MEPSESPPVVESVVESPAPETGETTETQPALEPTQDQLEAWFKGKTHDELKAIQAYNDKIQQHQARLNREADQRKQQEQSERAHNTEMARNLAYYESLPPDQFRQAMLHPEHAKRNADAVAWKARGGGQGLDPESIAKRIAENMLSYYRGHDDYQHVPSEEWDEMMMLSPDEFLKRLVNHGVSHRLTQAEKKHAAELEARVKEAQAKALGNRDEVDSVPGNGTAVVGGDLDRYINDPEYRKSLTPAQIDALTARRS